ncbi:hypothetical protein Tco_0363141 [Tanacetum coccineum]
MLGPGRYSQWRSRFLRRMKSIPAAQHHTTNYEHLFQRVDACNTSKRRCGLAIGKATSGLIIERTRCKDQSVLGNLEVYFLVMENPCSRNTHGFYKLKNELTGTTCKLGLMQVNVQFLQQPQTRMVKVVTLVKLKKKDTDLHITDYLTSPQAVSEGGLNHTTSVSRPQLKTSHVNAVCAECGKCVFNFNHDACVSRYLNDVNARTKKSKVVPISASKPKIKANKSVVTQHKETVASDTTIQISKSYHKELYENRNPE